MVEPGEVVNKSLDKLVLVPTVLVFGLKRAVLVEKEIERGREIRAEMGMVRYRNDSMINSHHV